MEREEAIAPSVVCFIFENGSTGFTPILNVREVRVEHVGALVRDWENDGLIARDVVVGRGWFQDDGARAYGES